MNAYYNEFDKGAAQWLRNLISAGKIPDGWVDERDIRLVQPKDLRPFVQCHFFAGIAGWSLALRLAGWDDSRPVWTGSCPCQPFSACGSRKGAADDRHLWPEFYRLIEKRRPPVVFGEQVDGPDGVEWLSGVRSDLEASGYAVGAVGLPAAGHAAPHLRQRLWWVADASEPFVSQVAPAGHERGDRQDPGALVDAQGKQVRLPGFSRERGGSDPWAGWEAVPCTDGKQRRVQPGVFPVAHGVPDRMVKIRAYGNAIVPQVAAEFVKAYMETQKRQSRTR